jgi:hypothetical protein
LSEALVSFKGHFLHGETLLTGLKLIIPSFLRNTLGIETHKEILAYTALDAGSSGGGFSLLAELYMNFGYCSCIFFVFAGMMLSYFNNRIFYKKEVSLLYSIGPLVYAYFILAFRNDLAVFIKQVVQLFIIVFFFLFLIKVSKKTNKIKI